MLRCFGIMGVYLLTSFNRFLKPSHGILPWSCLLRWWLLPKRQLTQQTTEPSGGAHTVTWEFVDFWTAYRTIGNKCHLMPTPLLQSRSHSGTSKAKTCDGVNTGNLDSMKRETFKLWEVSSRSDLYMEFRDSISLNFINSRSFAETNLNELVFWHAVCCRHWGCQHRLLGHRTPFHRAVYEVLVLTLAISLETHRSSKGVHDSCGSKSRCFFCGCAPGKKNWTRVSFCNNQDLDSPMRWDEAHMSHIPSSVGIVYHDPCVPIWVALLWPTTKPGREASHTDPQTQDVYCRGPSSDVREWESVNVWWKLYNEKHYLAGFTIDFPLPPASWVHSQARLLAKPSQENQASALKICWVTGWRVAG